MDRGHTPSRPAVPIEPETFPSESEAPPQSTGIIHNGPGGSREIPLDGSSVALYGYQMQLLQLEEQNKARLRVARSEQNLSSPPRPAPPEGERQGSSQPPEQQNRRPTRQGINEQNLWGGLADDSISTGSSSTGLCGTMPSDDYHVYIGQQMAQMRRAAIRGESQSVSPGNARSGIRGGRNWPTTVRGFKVYGSPAPVPASPVHICETGPEAADTPSHSDDYLPVTRNRQAVSENISEEPETREDDAAAMVVDAEPETKAIFDDPDLCDVGHEDSVTPEASSPQEHSDYAALHVVFCGQALDLYEDEPGRVPEENPLGHLDGTSLLSSVDHLLSRRPSLAFASIRRHNRGHYVGHHSCDILDGIMPLSEQLAEDLEAVSQYNKVGDPRLGDAWQTTPPIRRAFHGHTACATGNGPLGRPVYYKHFLFHHRPALRRLLDDSWCGNRQDLATLLWYLANRAPFASEFDRCDEQFGRGVVSRESLGYLFHPHQQLVMPCPNSMGEVRYTAVTLRGARWDEDEGTLALHCHRWAYDSVALHRKTVDLIFSAPRPGVEVPVTSLVAYPIRYAPEGVAKQLEERGRQFWAVRFPTLVAYEGWDATLDRRYARGTRFMVDFHSRQKTTAWAYTKQQSPCDPYDPDPEYVSNTTKTLTTRVAIGAPDELVAYHLEEGRRRPVLLNLSNVKPVGRSNTLFNQLIFPTHIKQALEMVVEGRMNEIRDVTTPPGPLVLSLSGPPGSGKTMTAAALAEAFKVALVPLRLDAGDEDEMEDEAESENEYFCYSNTHTRRDKRRSSLSLSSFLHRAGHAWHGILLVEGVDDLVYFGEPKQGEREPDRLVKARRELLSALSRYPGVVFLASNRAMRGMRPEFKKLVSIAVEYPALTQGVQQIVWNAGLAELGAEFGAVFIERTLTNNPPVRFCGKSMDGWQMRRVLDTMRAMARTGGGVTLERAQAACECLP